MSPRARVSGSSVTAFSDTAYGPVRGMSYWVEPVVTFQQELAAGLEEPADAVQSEGLIHLSGREPDGHRLIVDGRERPVRGLIHELEERERGHAGSLPRQPHLRHADDGGLRLARLQDHLASGGAAELESRCRVTVRGPISSGRSRSDQVARLHRLRLDHARAAKWVTPRGVVETVLSLPLDLGSGP